MDAAKLDRADEAGKHKTVSTDVRKLIIQGRNAKVRRIGRAAPQRPRAEGVRCGAALQGWTQKDLATRIQEKPQVINEYENGKAIPNNQVLGKIERQIGIKLRGKSIGEPLSGPKKK